MDRNQLQIVDIVSFPHFVWKIVLHDKGHTEFYKCLDSDQHSAVVANALSIWQQLHM